MTTHKKTMEWAAGLFCGEGSVWIHGSRNTFHLGLCMLDKSAVEMFAEIVRPHAEYKYRVKEKVKVSMDRGKYWRVHLGDAPAQSIALAIYPYISDTDKGRQIKTTFAKIGIDVNGGQ